jgi:hypothetical protein
MANRYLYKGTPLEDLTRDQILEAHKFLLDSLCIMQEDFARATGRNLLDPENTRAALAEREREKKLMSAIINKYKKTSTIASLALIAISCIFLSFLLIFFKHG